MRRIRFGRTGAAAATALLALSVQAREAPQVERIVDGDPILKVLPRGAIPAITDPEFVSAREADRFLAANEPVLGLVVDGQARAYSLWQLDHHEVVNDTAGGKDFAVTW